MLALIGVVAFSLLFLGFPFMITIFATVFITILFFLPGFDMMIIAQQTITGISPPAIICVPMFILAAEIILKGETATKLANFTTAYFGHFPGGIPICTNAACTLFGAVSGSTQATVAAIGGAFRPILLKGGYSSPFSLALIVNSSEIAGLIPPSIVFILYGICTKTSIGKLFLAGIGPGLLLFVMFSVFCFFYAKTKKLSLQPKCSWAKRRNATKTALPIFGFPLIILGGLYTGFFSPTEAAAASVLYALVLEGTVYRSLRVKKFLEIALATTVITAVTFILIGAGTVLNFLLTYLWIPQSFLAHVFGPEPSGLKIIIVINIAFFIACMFMDSAVAIFVLSPIFLPYVVSAGLDPIYIGVFVVCQAVLGATTPPFGCDIFTAMVVFRRPYFEVIREIGPFIAIQLIAIFLLILIPDIALFLPRYAFGA